MKLFLFLLSQIFLMCNGQTTTPQIVPPDGYQWVCANFSTQYKGDGITVSENMTYAQSTSQDYYAFQTEQSFSHGKNSGPERYMIPFRLEASSLQYMYFGIGERYSTYQSSSSSSYGPLLFHLHTTDVKFDGEWSPYGDGTILKQGDVVQVLLDKVNGTVNFTANNHNLGVAAQDDRFKSGEWFVTFFMNDKRGISVLHNPDGCMEEEMTVPTMPDGQSTIGGIEINKTVVTAEVPVIEDLIEELGLNPKLQDVVESIELIIAAQDNQELTRILLASALTNGQRTQLLSEDVKSKESMFTESKRRDYLLDIFLSPLLPTGPCMENSETGTLIDAKSLTLISRLSKLAQARNQTLDPAKTLAYSETIFNLLMQYPSDMAQSLSSDTTTTRDVIYSKVNDIKSSMKLSSKANFEMITGVSYELKSEDYINTLVQEMIESAAMIFENLAAPDEDGSGSVINTVEQIALLQVKYQDIL